MMRQLEVFFDYACPYCWKAHQLLLDLLPLYPDVEVVWRPCESHPQPERYGMHSDLVIQGLLFAIEHGMNLLSYHKRAYELIMKNHVNVENADTLASSLSDLLDANSLRNALIIGKYRTAQQAANDYAFEQSGVWVVPAYRLDGHKLDSIEDVFITKTQLTAFLKNGDE